MCSGDLWRDQFCLHSYSQLLDIFRCRVLDEFLIGLKFGDYGGLKPILGQRGLDMNSAIGHETITWLGRSVAPTRGIWTDPTSLGKHPQPAQCVVNNRCLWHFGVCSISEPNHQFKTGGTMTHCIPLHVASPPGFKWHHEPKWGAMSSDICQQEYLVGSSTLILYWS